MKNLNDLIARLKEADGSRTPGPWNNSPGEYVGFVGEQFYEVFGPKDEDGDHIVVCPGRLHYEDVSFITLTANSMPEIIQALETQSKVIEKMREALRLIGNSSSLNGEDTASARLSRKTIKECEALEGGDAAESL